MSRSTIIVPNRFARTKAVQEQQKPEAAPLAPSVTSPLATPTAPKQLSLPDSQVGVPVPYAIGTFTINSPNILWYGNENLEPKQTVTVGPTGDEEWLIEFRQTIDIQFGLCTGPGVRLRELLSNETVVWTGTAGPAPTTFSTTAAEGVFLGEVTFYGGEFTQIADPLLEASIFGENVPGFVGIAHMVISQGNRNGDYGKLAMKCDRLPNPLALSSGDNVNADGDINLVTAMIDVLTSDWNAGGLDIANFNTASFVTAAEILADEGQYVSLVIQDERVTPEQVVSQLEEQANGTVFTHPETGLITFTLQRTDLVDLEDPDIVHFDETNIVQDPDFNKIAWTVAYDQVRVLYSNRDDNFNEAVAIAQSISVASQGGRAKKTLTKKYPGVTNGTLANDLAARDLSINSIPRYAFKLEVNRDGADCLPGQVVTLSWANYQMENVPLQVVKRRDHPPKSNRVTLEVAQWEFPPNNALFPPPDDNDYTGDTFDPLPPTDALLIDAPFQLAKYAQSGGFANIDTNVGQLTNVDANADLGFIYMPVEAGNKNQYYVFARKDGEATPFQLYEGRYATTALLGNAMSKYDGFNTGIIASVDFYQVRRHARTSFMNGFFTANVRNAGVLMFIDDEILSYESYAFGGVGNQTLTLTNVHRGLYDTVAQDHAEDAKIFICELPFYERMSFTRYDPSAAVSPFQGFDLTSKSFKPPSTFSIESTAYETNYQPLVDRWRAPLRPHDTRINGGTRTSSAVNLTRGDAATVEWRIRSRFTPPGLYVVDGGSGLPLYPIPNTQLPATPVRTQLDDDDFKEFDGTGFVQYRVFIRDSAAVEHDCGATVDNDQTVNDLAITVPLGAAAGAGSLWVQAENAYSNSARFRDELPVNLT